jgi:hypothetical protein
MIDARTAVAAVNSYIKSFPDLLQLSSPRLEETETDPDTGEWLITLSAIDDPDLSFSLGRSPTRVYRQFRVREGTGLNMREGEVVSMKIRRLDD